MIRADAARLTLSEAAVPGARCGLSGPASAIVRRWTCGIVLAATLLAGCATIEPVQAPVSTSLPAAGGPFWRELTSTWPGDRLDVLNAGAEALEWRLRAIDSAVESIDLQTFLWTMDESGAAVAARIAAAADRGVRVRILLDDTFTVGEGTALAALAGHPGVELRIYNPMARRPDGLVLRQVENLGDFARIDRRMLSKVMITDTRAAIVGGRNIPDEYFGRHPDANFRDLELLLVGPAVDDLASVFDEYWNDRWSVPAGDLLASLADSEQVARLRDALGQRARQEKPRSPGSLRIAWTEFMAGAAPGEVRVLADEPAGENPADTTPDQLARALIEHLGQARDEIVVVSAYFIPTAELEAAIRSARQRGVEVRVLTNSLRSNNHTAAHAAYRGFIRKLIDHGVELHEVRALAKDRARYMLEPIDGKHLGLHAKALLIDADLSFVGSANLDPRSLQPNTEMGLLVRSAELNRRLRDYLPVDFDPRNAWHVQQNADGELVWPGDDQTLRSQPAESMLQRLEDWFLAVLPIRDKM
jgi:putative cardiolipin synthase